MVSSFQAPAIRPWRLGILVGVPLGAFVNLAIIATGVGEDTPGVADPGPVNSFIYTIVPFVWVGLYAAIATAILILRPIGRDAALPAAATTLLLVNCLLYPVYTLGFSSMDLGLAGNILTALLAAFAAGAAARPAPAAALLMAPVIGWVSLASIGLVAVMTGRTF